MNDHDVPAGPPQQDRIEFLIDLGRSLHGYGLPAHRLEAALVRTAADLGIRAEFFSTPTSLICSFGEPGRQQTSLSRVEPADLQLDKLVELDAIVRALERGELSVAQADGRLKRLAAAPRRHGPLATALAFALVSCTASRFFAGGLREMSAALALGLLTGLLAWLAGRSLAVGRVYEFLVSLAVTFLAHGVASLGLPLASGQVVVAGLIVLLPGLTLTLALNELATGHLVSGTARLMGALMTFLKIGLGVGLGAQLAAFLPGPLLETPATTLPGWTLWACLLASPVGLAVLFRARWRELPWIQAGSIVAYWSARYGVALLGAGLGSVAGALTAGVAANAYARARRKPSVVVVVPSIILLVPGAVGYRSFSMLMQKDVLSGVDSAFMVLLVGVSLVAGLLLANVLVPPRREL